jgi:hypothetical protein
MLIVVAIDDTDDLTSRGTGELASLIAEAVRENGWGIPSIVTRHQLLVHPDIPYTSHNSAMCFQVDLTEGCLEQVISYAAQFLERESAEGSDPGLCVAPVGGCGDQELIAFGRRAKCEVLTMPEAYQLAQHVGVHLSQHGGTGQGVIGALAGAGLRLWGNDGRMKGSLDLGQPGTRLTVRQIVARPEVDAVLNQNGATVPFDALVEVGEKPKTVLMAGISVLLVGPASEGAAAPWQTLHRKQLRNY